MTGDDQNVLAYLCSRDPDQRDRYRERILAEALLRDLGRQLRPSIYSVNFLRRHRGVVLFRRAEPGGAQWTFIEKCLEALAPRDRSRYPIRRTPLQIVAACGDVPPDDEPPRRSIDAGANALTEAAESLTSVPARTNDQECATLLHVPVPGEEPKEAAAHWYRDTATEYRRGRWYDYLLPVTAVLVTGAVIAEGLRIGCDFLHRSEGATPGGTGAHGEWRTWGSGHRTPPCPPTTVTPPSGAG